MPLVLLASTQYPPWSPSKLGGFVGQLHEDGTTATIRQVPKRGPPSDHYRRFTYAIRLTADAWNFALDASHKAGWKALAADQTARRPLTNPCPANGWDLFSNYYFSHLWFTTWPKLPGIPPHQGYPYDLLLVSAVASTQIIKISYELATYVNIYGECIVAAFHINPKFNDKPGMFRQTHLAGYHVPPSSTTLTWNFTFPPQWPFAAGETVQLLVRSYVARRGVRNYLREVVAT